jgi:hypothetical protein
MAPGSELLEQLGGDETPDGPEWMSLWTTQDQIVKPPETARLEGAINVPLQDLCPGLRLSHGALTSDPVVQAVVVEALSAEELTEPTGDVCS